MPPQSSPVYVVAYLGLFVTVMRAFLVRAQLLPATCSRCGLRFERKRLGENVCRCVSER
jgi:hypothetical protein